MNKQTNSILDILAEYPRANLLSYPSPIHKLPRLSSRTGYDIYILRDDLTGFALGGNKTRKLDFLVGDAIAQKADTLVTMKATSFSRNAAAAGRVCGFDVHVVLAGKESEQNPRSQDFFKQHDTKLHYVTEDKENALKDTYERVVKFLKKQGKAVYELHPGGSDSIGALGYVSAFQEILDYSQKTGIHFSDIVLSLGSTGTKVGLILGQCISRYETRIIGIAASLTEDMLAQRINELVSATARMLGIDVDRRNIHVDDRFIGPGYAIPSEEGKSAVEVFASTEGILLDQVYTGKAAAALLHYSLNRKFHDNILFVHTGGNSGLYY